jgi:crossover junction endodeoxyribonuclease RuvC
MDKLKIIKPKEKKKKGVVRGDVTTKVCESVTECRDPMFVGIDPSINATGLIVLDKHANIIEQKLFSVKSEKFEEGLLKYENEISFIPKIMNLQSVYLEGPAYQATGQVILQMGALHFMTRLFLFKNHLNYKIIAPGTLKKFVTGSGRAKKDLMLLKVYKKWGVEFEDHNLSDAYGLARMALEGVN